MRPTIPALSFAIVAACGPSSPSPERVPDRALACARLSGCVASDGGYDDCRSGLFTDALSTVQPSVVACVLAATDCDGALRCVHSEHVRGCVDPASACDGDVLRDCFLGLEVRRDCAAEALSCVDNGNLACGSETSCAGSRCEGDRLFTCVGGEREVVRECEPGRCHVDPETGLGRCLPSLETCERGTAYCDGDVAVRCSEGFLARTLCQPGQCRETDGAFCFEETACTSACDGATLLACIEGGRREPIDCTQWGYTQCVDRGSGARCAH